MSAAIQKIFNQAIAAFNSGDLEKAEEGFRRAIQADSSHVPALNLLTVILMSTGRFGDAEPFIARAVKLNQSSDISFYNYGLIAKKLNKPQLALEQFTNALALNPTGAETWNNRGTIYNDLERYDLAISDFNKALEINSSYAEAYANKGKSLTLIERYDEASAAYDKALSIKPGLAEAWFGRGKAFAGLRRHDKALAAYDEALSIKPDLAEGWLDRGNVFRSLQRHDEAFASYDKALSIKPDLEGAWLGRGNVFWSLKRHDEAFAAYDKALSIKPDLAEAWLGRGNALADLQRYDEAFAAYDKALSIKPDLEGAWLGRGNVFWGFKRHDEAFAAYDKALSIKPDLEGAWLGRGNAFADLKRDDEAFAAYDKALSIKPDLAEAWLGRGNVFWRLKHYAEAFAAYDKALSIKPDLAEAWLSRGNAFADLKRYDEAFAAYDQALSMKPDLESVEGARLHTKMHLCNWNNLDAEIAHLVASISAGKPNSAPFHLLSLVDSPDEQLRCAKAWILANTPSPCEGTSPTQRRDKHNKIRIGYVSADFRVHPVSYLSAGLFDSHDRTRFETFAFSVGFNDHSKIRQRLEKSFDKFFDLGNASDIEIIDTIKSSEIDILIDLNGHTEGARTAIFAHRPAPIAVNYLGYAGSMGAEFYDYVVMDKTIANKAHLNSFSEKLIHLPHSFMPHDAESRVISSLSPNRSEQHLPNDGVVFCCFNNSYKLNPNVFRSWMRILDRVDDSVLWLSDMSEVAKKNLQKEAGKFGIDGRRLIFASRTVSSADHLARHRLADLFLDTLPYNAHTTAGDALWAGLPVLTQIGHAFAGRVAASLLNAVGLPELVTHSAGEFEDLAIELARNSEKLGTLKEKLARNRLAAPLFDTSLYTRHLEAAYEAMYRRYQAGLPPDHIEIAPVR